MSKDEYEDKSIRPPDPKKPDGREERGYNTPPRPPKDDGKKEGK